MDNITFANPEFFYLLFLLIPLIIWYVWKDSEANAAIRFSTLKGFSGAGRTAKYWLRHILFAVRLIILSLIIVVLARPQSVNKWQDVNTEGIDIIIALDISGSMLAQDFRPDRLEASKAVAIEFVSGRPTDRIGLVVYSAESFTQCPLTTDHAVLINLFHDIKSGMIEDGTAIGMGLANAVSRLKDSKAKSKVIILLTDGVNNRGSIAPLTAAEIARTFNIRVYTIGVGTQGTAPAPVQTPYGVQIRQVPVEIDEQILQQIAQVTDGKYFRATNNQKLIEIYKEIDQMEKSKIDVREYSRKEEEYLAYGLGAVILLLFEIIIRKTVLRNIP
jgi:Ca-activated chloride channel family protein